MPKIFADSAPKTRRRPREVKVEFNDQQTARCHELEQCSSSELCEIANQNYDDAVITLSAKILSDKLSHKQIKNITMKHLEHDMENNNHLFHLAERNCSNYIPVILCAQSDNSAAPENTQPGIKFGM